MKPPSLETIILAILGTLVTAFALFCCVVVTWAFVQHMGLLS